MKSSPSTPKRRGRLKTPAKTQPSNPVAPAGQHTTTNEDILAGLVDKIDSKLDLKAEMTQRELKFLEIYLTGEHNLDKAMILAGFEGYHPHSLYRLGRKIVQKYEQQAGDHRKIMRAMGYGETKVLKLLIDSAENAKSEMVRLNARAILAKCLGLHQDVVAVNQGIQIIIKGRDDARAGGGRPAQVNQDQPRALPATLSITK